MNMEEAIRIAPGVAVQIDPSYDEVFGGCIVIVTEVRGWGVIGYVPLVNKQWAYIRIGFDSIESIGKARWVQE